MTSFNTNCGGSSFLFGHNKGVLPLPSRISDSYIQNHPSPTIVPWWRHVCPPVPDTIPIAFPPYFVGLISAIELPNLNCTSTTTCNPLVK